jgi:hypothetical protein
MAGTGHGGDHGALHSSAGEGTEGGGGFGGKLVEAVVGMAVAPLEHFVAEDMGNLLIKDVVNTTAVEMAENSTSLGDPVKGTGSVSSGEGGGGH